MEKFVKGVKRTIAVILLLMLLPVAALADYSAVVTASKMKVYSTNKVNDKYYLGYLKKNIEFIRLKSFFIIQSWENPLRLWAVLRESCRYAEQCLLLRAGR